MMNRTWWKEAVVYQIYPRSFNDSNGDGIGDLPGIIERLDHIQSLGVDVIWVCPVYKSPNDDNGYDISDYRDIMNEFGTMADFDRLLEEVHHRKLKLVMDLVANHSSDEHTWFQESRKSTDNPYRDYYFWRPGKNGGPPNNWRSFFGGSAWQYDETTGEYYLHLFTSKQVDLNWENEKVRREIYDIMKFWFDKGVDGFRMDVISLISKQLDFPDVREQSFGDTIREVYANGPRIHEYLHEMYREVLSHYDVMTVGEGPGIDLKNAPLYVREDRQELQTVFHFDHMFIDNGPDGKYDPVPYDMKRFKEVFEEWDARLADGGWGSIFLGNHDFSRIVSRFGNDSLYHVESAKLLVMLLMTMRGTVYIYQGDEIGMTNVKYPSIDDYQDVETLGAWKEAREAGKDPEEILRSIHWQSRDNARTPMQWNTASNAGFSSGQPWLKVNPNYREINVSQQENDPASILNFYRRMIAFRKDHSTLVYGDFDVISTESPELFVFERKDSADHFRIYLNMSDFEEKIPDKPSANPVVYNYQGADSPTLRPWEGRIYKL